MSRASPDAVAFLFDVDALALATPAPDEPPEVPRITPEELDAFAAWRRAHPPMPSMASTEHSEWMRFQSARLLAEMRERAPASGGAPPATSTTEPES